MLYIGINIIIIDREGFRVGELVEQLLKIMEITNRAQPIYQIRFLYGSTIHATCYHLGLPQGILSFFHEA